MMYALNDAQTKLAKANLQDGVITLVNVSLPPGCSTVTAFAKVSP